MLEESKRNKALDGLRGLAAVSVIFYHGILHHEVLVSTVLLVPIQSLHGTREIITKFFLFLFDGSNAVILFFVLSGFVLKLSLDRTSQKPAFAATTSFVIRRFLRLYPAMFTCMAAYYLIATFYRKVGLTGFPQPDLLGAIKNAVLTQTLWHGPSSTIQAEVLAIPFVVAFFYVIASFGAAGAMLVIAYSVLALDNLSLTFYLPNMNLYLAAFAVGMVAACKSLQSLFVGLRPTVIWLTILAFMFARMFVNLASGIDSLAQIILAALLILVVTALSDRHPVRRFLVSAPVHALGRISYSLYLLNVLVLLVIWSFTDKTTIYASYALEVGLVIGLATMLITIPLAALSERFIEQPAISLSRHILELFKGREVVSVTAPS